MDYYQNTVVVFAGAVAVGAYIVHRSRSERGPELRGPPRTNPILGQTKAMLGGVDTRDVIAEWAAEYGGMFFRPGPAGTGDVCVTDPRAVAHILSHSHEIWHISPPVRFFMEKHVGRGVLSSDGDDHKRQRRVLSPGFSRLKIREYGSVFRDCAAQLAAQWDAELGVAVAGECSVDVSKWFTAYALDTIGLAGFGHAFGALAGQASAISAAFDGLTQAPLGVGDLAMVALQLVVPRMRALPSAHWRAVDTLHEECGRLARALLARDREVERENNSIMGLMIRAEAASSGSGMSEAEVATQIRTLLVAGYETTSAMLTWAMSELCRYPELQTRLRAELSEAFPGGDPTVDDLANGAPLLDAFVSETLRLHHLTPPSVRTAQRDDIVPLFTPLTLADGTTTDRVHIKKGTVVSLHGEVIDTSTALWGADAHEFRPNRWLTALPEGAQAVSGYHHLMTFGDGPKACLGRSFAIANMKTLLASLLQRYTFAWPEGAAPELVARFTLVNRPAVKGQEGFAVRMKITRVDG